MPLRQAHNLTGILSLRDSATCGRSNPIGHSSKLRNSVVHSVECGSSQGYIGGDGSADALMGLPQYICSQTEVPNGPPTIPGTQAAFPYYGLYVNDLFRLSPKLSILAGLRYDLSIPVCSTDTESNPCYPVYVPSASGGVEAYGQKSVLSAHAATNCRSFTS